MAHTHHDQRAGWRPAARRRLALTFGLIASFFVVELAYGLLSGSLALISDAGHMAADVVTLGAALAAMRVAARPDTTGRRTYGSYRAEIFASLFAVAVMLAVAGYIVAEAVSRAGDAVHVQPGPMIVVGAAGLLVNIVAMLLLRADASASLAVKGAYLEVLADAAGSVGVLAAGALVAATADAVWDTVVALAIGVFVVVRALALGRHVFAVLAQHAPFGMDLAGVAADLRAVEGVRDVHDLHVWTLTSGMNVATAHLVACDDARPEAVLDQAQRVLRERHEIAHATVQVEPARRDGCDELTW